MILQNAVICNKCDDYIFSGNRHDFKSCKCGAVSVDGGMDYLRRVGDFKDCTDMSYSLEDDIVKEGVEAVKWAEDTGRNHLGTFLAVVRALRGRDRFIAEGELRIMAQHEDEVMVVEADGTVNRYKKVV